MNSALDNSADIVPLTVVQDAVDASNVVETKRSRRVVDYAAVMREVKGTNRLL